MLRILTLNPFVGIQLAIFLQTGVIIMILLDAHNWNPEKNSVKFYFMKIFSSLFGTIYTIAGVLFLDIALFWIFGPWGKTDWRWQLPSVILLILAGGFYLYRTIWLSKNKKMAFVFLFITASSIVVLLHVFTYADPLMGVIIEENLPTLMIILVIIGFSIGVVDLFLWKKKVDSGVRNKIIEKKSRKLIIFNGILWILIVAQAILTYYGISLNIAWFFLFSAVR